MSVFTDPHTVARYTEGPARLVPGLRDLHRMTALLLAEHAGEGAGILVLGAGGGQELDLFARYRADWRFLGVDPSAEMLALAREVTRDHAARIDWHEGYIDDAPTGPFEGATCLLTLHFRPREERLHTLTELRRRLKPGAPLIVAHHSVPEAGRALWLRRYADFAASNGVPPESARTAAAAIAERLPLLSPTEDEALLQEAGFTDVGLFYAGFTFRGWVATT